MRKEEKCDVGLPSSKVVLRSSVSGKNVPKSTLPFRHLRTPHVGDPIVRVTSLFESLVGPLIIKRQNCDKTRLPNDDSV